MHYNNNIVAPSVPPKTLYMSNADFVSRKLTFSWSTDCGTKLHYNILASNCGSCPTTTNHTNVTCTDVPTENSVCIFAIQTVVCGNISGQISYPIRATILNPTSYAINSSDSCRTYIVSTKVLATVLSVSIVVSITIIVIVIVIARRKAAKTQAGLDLQLTNRAEKSRVTDSMYEDVIGPLPSASAINTQDNVAYHHTHKQKN